MDVSQPTLDDLISELRSNANDDKAFAQRVASACALIADLAEPGTDRAKPGEAIRSIFCAPAPADGRVH